MYAVKFKANVCNGFIKIPQKYKILESKCVEIVAMVQDHDQNQDQNENQNQNNKQDDLMPEVTPELVNDFITDDYLMENWKELLSTGLSEFDEDYFKSDQYRFDRGSYLTEKYK